MCKFLNMEDERNSEIKSIDKNILDLFWKLSDKNVDVRINSCTDIIQTVFKKQLEEENEELCRDLEYCIERLVKGLASSRDAARLGYTLLLTEILKNIPVVQVEIILELMRKHLTLTVKQDRRDLIFGQLFCYSALVRSQRLPNHVHLSHVVTALIDLCQGRNFILNAVYTVILDIFSQISVENFKDVWNELKKKLPSDWETCSADSLWLLMLSIRLFPNVVGPKYMKNHWKDEDLFVPENLVYIKKIIKQTTSCLPNLHPLCTEFVLLIKQRNDFRDIWNAVVDDNLFLEQNEKSFVGFEMMKAALQDSPTKKTLKIVLSPKFRIFFPKCYLNNKHPLNPAATHLAKFLLDFVKNNAVPDMQITILKAFLQPPGTVLLDQILRKEEVSRIIQNLLPDAVKAFCEILKSIILKNKSDNDEKEVYNITHPQALHQITSLIVHPVTLSDLEWRMSVIKFLFLHSFFVIKEATSEILHCEKNCEALPDAMRDSCMAAFYKAVNSLHIRTNNQQSSLSIFLEQVMHLIEYAEILMNASENLEPKFSLEKVQNSWGHLKSILHKLQKQNKKDRIVEESSAFMTLFLQLGFHLFQDPESISETLEELYICCKKFLKTHKHEPEDSENDDNDEPPWIGVVVDILLFLLSKPSSYFRTLVIHVFPLFCSFIDESALQQILDVINPQKDSEDMLVDENESDAEGEEGIEFESGSSSDEADENTDVVDEEFKKKVQQALGTAADDSEAESVVLSDSEMFKLDSALSEVFKSRVKSGHTQMKEEEKTLLNFRVRCLDLIISYLKSEPPMHLVLMCMEPILTIIEFGHRSKHQQDLVKKAVSVLDSISKIRKFQHHEKVDKSELKRLLDVLILRCHKEINMSISQKLSHLCVFIVLCYRKLTNADSPEKKTKLKAPSYIKTYLSALDTFVISGSSHMLPQFFTHLMEACPDTAKHFIEPCKNYAFSNKVRLFRRTQCLGLLSESLKYSKSQKDIVENEWVDYASSIFPLAIEGLKSAVEPVDIKPVYVTELLNVIYSLHIIIKEKTDQSVLLKHCDLLPVLENMSSKKLKKLKGNGTSLRNKLIVSLGGTVDKGKKAEISSEKSDENPSSDREKIKIAEVDTEVAVSNNDEISNSGEATDQLNGEEVQPSKKKRKTKEFREATANLLNDNSEKVVRVKKLKSKKKKNKEKQSNSAVINVTNS